MCFFDIWPASILSLRTRIFNRTMLCIGTGYSSSYSVLLGIPIGGDHFSLSNVAVSINVSSTCYILGFHSVGRETLFGQKRVKLLCRD
jgi:hypothetical protein